MSRAQEKGVMQQILFSHQLSNAKKGLQRIESALIKASPYMKGAKENILSIQNILQLNECNNLFCPPTD